jgi:hypothetical protein
MLFSPGYPGFLRGLAPAGPGTFVVATSGGQIARYRPGDGETDYLADGFDQLYGVAIGPGDTIVFAELGTGRVHSLRSGNAEVLASGLRDPLGVAFDPNGNPLVSESGAGRVMRLAASTVPVVEGLQRPHGLPLPPAPPYIFKDGAKAVIAFDSAPATAARSPLACRSARHPVWNPSRSRECRRSPGPKSRSPASPSAWTARCTFRPTATAAF